jgi:hypothetical protein
MPADKKTNGVFLGRCFPSPCRRVHMQLCPCLAAAVHAEQACFCKSTRTSASASRFVCARLGGAMAQVADMLSHRCNCSKAHAKAHHYRALIPDLVHACARSKPTCRQPPPGPSVQMQRPPMAKLRRAAQIHHAHQCRPSYAFADASDIHAAVCHAAVFLIGCSGTCRADLRAHPCWPVACAGAC